MRRKKLQNSFLQSLARSKIFWLCLFPLFVLLITISGGSYYQNFQVVYREPEVRFLPFLPPSASDYPQSELGNFFASARAVFVFDPDSNTTTYSRNENLRLPPASTTKLVTGMVTVKNCPLEKIITVSQFNKEGTRMGLVKGERISVENLLYGLLVTSGNDAAGVLAQNCAGDLSKGEFIDQMNQIVETLKLPNTHFTNPSGLDELGHFSSAKDLGLIAAEAIKNPIIAKMVNTISITVRSVDGKQVHQLVNVNKLLAREDIYGIKTGKTEAAKENLILLAVWDNRRIISVILGSSDRFGESNSLIDMVYKYTKWLKF
ncbi:MAG TPA: hypothetical protein VIK81_00495 [Patescibacteria group bacterium]